MDCACGFLYLFTPNQGGRGACIDAGPGCFLQPVSKRTVERNGYPHIEPSPDERKSQFLSCALRDLDAQAALDTFPGFVEHPPATLKHSPEFLPLARFEARLVRLVCIGVQPQFAPFQVLAITAETAGRFSD